MSLKIGGEVGQLHFIIFYNEKNLKLRSLVVSWMVIYAFKWYLLSNFTQ